MSPIIHREALIQKAYTVDEAPFSSAHDKKLIMIRLRMRIRRSKVV